MKTLRVLLIVFGIIGFVVRAMPKSNTIQLEAENTIFAGDAWEVAVNIADGTNGDQVSVILFNGLQTFNEMLTLGTGGVAVWRIDEGQLTQAGESLLMVSYNDLTVNQTLRVLPEAPTQVDLFTTANTIPSYGEGSATLLILPRDRWGNPPPNNAWFFVNATYPNGEQTVHSFEYTSGIGWYDLLSTDLPGRVRLNLDQDALSASLELIQSPGEPQFLSLSIQPECILNDGRDLITLVAEVRDSHRNLVADGTFVRFTWEDGLGFGRTIGGQATLEMPAPDGVGEFSFYAFAGEAQSQPAQVRVVEGLCADE